MKTAISGLFKKKEVKQLGPFFKAAKPMIADNGKEIYLDVHGRPVPDADIQFYPPKVEGLSVFTEEAIIQRYYREIELLNKSVRIGSHRKAKDGTSLFDARYLSVIRNLTSYVHMLPASEYNHHSQPGGLFRHSLEAGLFALQYADNKLPPTTGAVDLDEERRPRYLFAAWLGGLLHDIGKVITDVRVQPLMMFDGKRSVSILDWPHKVRPWIPHLEPLTEWAKKNKVERYSLHFVKGRFKQHESNGNALLPAIVKGEALEFILESPDNLYGALNASLSGYLHDSSYLSNAIRYGDSLSVKKDSKLTVNAQFGIVRRSKKSNIINIMRTLRKEWDCNHQKAQMWIVGDVVFLRWEAAFHSIIKKSKELRLDDISQDTTTLHHEMEDMIITERFDKENSSVLFSEGEFEAEDALAIAEGKRDVRWVELIKVHYKEWVFDYDPLPPSARGIMFLEATNEFILTFENGVTKSVDLHSISDSVKENDGLPAPTIVEVQATESKNDGSQSDEPDTPTTKEHADDEKRESEVDEKPGNSSEKPKPKPKPKPKKAKQLTFVNAKATTEEAEAKEAGAVESIKDHVVEKERPAEAVHQTSQATQKTHEPRAASEPAGTAEVSAEHMLIVERIASIQHLVAPVKNHKHAVPADKCAEAWGLSVKEAGMWLKSTSLLKVNMQSIALTFLANTKEGKEAKFFALSPKVARFLNVPNEVAPKKLSVAQKDNEKQNEALPKSIQLSQLLKRSPQGTLGAVLRSEIGESEPESFLELKGQQITFDLFKLLDPSKTGRIDHDKYESIYNALVDWSEGNIDPVSDTVFTISIEALKKVEIR